MDLFAKNNEAEEVKDNANQQLSLDLNASSETNPETPPQAEEKTVEEIPAAKKRNKKDDKKETQQPKEGFLNIGVGSFGKYLQDMRNRNNYSIAQVEQLTKIKAKYIELLEMENPGLELPPVYVMAYARKLCACYKVPEAETLGLVNELKDKMREAIPPEMVENIKIDYEINEDNQRRLRNFAWVILGSVLTFIVLIAISIYILLAPSKPTKTVNPETPVAIEKFDPEKLKVLQPPVIIEASELPPKQ